MASKKKEPKAKEAKKPKAKEAKKPKARRGPRMCPCPSTVAREELKKAKTCGSKRAALEKLKRIVGEESEGKKPGPRAFAFRELLKKEAAVQSFCAAEEKSDASRFNGLGRIGRRRRRRRH